MYIILQFSEHICIIFLIKHASNEHTEFLSSTTAVLCSEVRTAK